MNPTQEEIDGALRGADMYKSRGPASFAQEDAIILAAAYRAEKERSEQATSLYVAAHEAGMSAKHRAELAERQYAELATAWAEKEMDPYEDEIIADHERERKALCQST